MPNVKQRKELLADIVAVCDNGLFPGRTLLIEKAIENMDLFEYLVCRSAVDAYYTVQETLANVEQMLVQKGAAL